MAGLRGTGGLLKSWRRLCANIQVRLYHPPLLSHGWLVGGMSLSVIKLIALIWVGLGLVTQAQARQIEFNRDAATDPTELAKEMPRLANERTAQH